MVEAFVRVKCSVGDKLLRKWVGEFVVNHREDGKTIVGSTPNLQLVRTVKDLVGTQLWIGNPATRVQSTIGRVYDHLAAFGKADDYVIDDRGASIVLATDEADGILPSSCLGVQLACSIE